MSRLDHTWPARVARGATGAVAWLTVALGPRASRAEEPPAEVVVQGERARTSSRDPTAASTVVSGADLARPGAASSDVLARVPGVQIGRTGAASDLATASVRGATAAQTPIYLAGVRLNDDVGGAADLSTVPLFLIQRAEIFRGNAPEHADRLGVGGAVFFEPRLPQRTEVHVGQLVGSFGTSGSWVTGAAAGPRAATLVALRRDAAANDYPYVDDAGTRFSSADDTVVRRSNADFTSTGAWAIGNYRLGSRARVTALVNVFDREQGVTGYSVVPAAQSRAHVQRELFATSAQVPCAAELEVSASRCSVELVTSAVVARQTVTDPALELALGTPRTDTQGQRVGQRVRLRLAPSERFAVALGLEGSAETLSLTRAQPQEPFVVAATRHVARPSATVHVRPVPPLELVALGAAECHATDGPEGPASCTPQGTGRLGGRLDVLDGVSVLANVGRFVRVPTLAELHGAAPLVRGNAELAPERATGGDVGLRLGPTRAASTGLAGALEVVAYRRHAADLVAYRRSLRQLVPYNVGAARIQGLEVSGEARFRDVLRLESSASLLDPRDTTPTRAVANDILPFSSRLTLASTLEGNLYPTRAHLDRLTLGGRMLHRSSRYQDPAGLIVIPHQTTFDLEATLALAAQRLTLRATLSDVFDAPQWDFLGLALPGRAFYASGELALR